MTIAKEKIFDDLAKMAGGTIGILSDTKQQIHEDMKSRIDELATNIDLVPREDFERLESIIQNLEKRIETLEAKKNKKTKTKK